MITNQWSRSNPGGRHFTISHCRIFIGQGIVAGWPWPPPMPNGHPATDNRRQNSPRAAALESGWRSMAVPREWPSATRWRAFPERAKRSCQPRPEVPGPDQRLFSRPPICTHSVPRARLDFAGCRARKAEGRMKNDETKYTSTSNAAFEFNKESMRPGTGFASAFLVSWFPYSMHQHCAEEILTQRYSAATPLTREREPQPK